MPMYSLPSLYATAAVVPEPEKGSRTTPPSGQPARMHGSTSLSGKTAVVTGSTAGVGYSIAKSLALAGAQVVVNGRKAVAVDEAVAKLAAEVTPGGVSGIAGSAGGGLTPWAVIGSNATAGETGASVYATRAATQNYSLNSYGAAAGLHERVELSLARQDFDASPAVALNSPDTGTGLASVMTMPPVKSGEDEDTQRSAPASPDAPTAHAREQRGDSGQAGGQEQQGAGDDPPAAARAAPAVNAETWAPWPSPSARACPRDRRTARRLESMRPRAGTSTTQTVARPNVG